MNEDTVLCSRFPDWPEDALEKVATVMFQDMQIEETIREPSVKLCQYFHTTVEKASVR